MWPYADNPSEDFAIHGIWITRLSGSATGLVILLSWLEQTSNHLNINLIVRPDLILFHHVRFMTYGGNGQMDFIISGTSEGVASALNAYDAAIRNPLGNP